MALPTILIDSATGSDSAASGAGPATAITGICVTDIGGTTVTLDAGTDLSGVVTDGSHVIWIDDSGSFARNFSPITGKAGSGGATPTVTVASAFTGALAAKTWAIGGKRATLDNSRRLLENGDASTGWIIEMADGHTETIATGIAIRADGDYTYGPITIGGRLDAVTRPVISYSENGALFYYMNYGINPRFQSMVILNTNATKTASSAFTFSGRTIFYNITVGDATNYFWRGWSQLFGTFRNTFVRCEAQYCASHGFYSEQPSYYFGCTSHHNGDAGFSNNTNGSQFNRCIAHDNAGPGFYNIAGTDDTATSLITHCTSARNGGHGFDLITYYGNPSLFSSIAVDNGGYGFHVDFQNTEFRGGLVANLAGYNNTSGLFSTAPGANDAFDFVTLTGDPFTDAAGGDFSLNTVAGAGAACRAASYPGAFPGGLTTDYSDIGAVQHAGSAAAADLAANVGRA